MRRTAREKHRLPFFFALGTPTIVEVIEMYILKMKYVDNQGHKKSNRELMRFVSLDRAIKMLNSMANEELEIASGLTERACLTILEDGGIQVRTGKRSKRIFRLIEERS